MNILSFFRDPINHVIIDANIYFGISFVPGTKAFLSRFYSLTPPAYHNHMRKQLLYFCFTAGQTMAQRS